MKTPLELAKSCLPRVQKLLPHILEAAKTYNFEPALLAAILTRETSALSVWCEPPPVGKLGDNGFGHGPMQIDKRSFPEWCSQWSSGKLTVRDGILKGAEVLAMKQKAIGRLLPQLTGEEALKAAVAAYNCGEGNVKKAVKAGKPVDAYTARGDYAEDVFIRRKFYQTVL